MGHFTDRNRIWQAGSATNLGNNQTDINSSGTDLANYDGCLMLAETATVAASGTLEFGWEDGDDNSTWADVGSDTLDLDQDDDNIPILHDIGSTSADRYVRMTVDKGGGNSQLTCLYLIRYGLHTGLPSSQPGNAEVQTMPVPFTKRYVRANFDKSTAASAFRTALYLRYGPHHKPAVQDSDTKHASIGGKLIDNIRVDVALASNHRASGTVDRAGATLDMQGGWAGIVLLIYTGTFNASAVCNVTWQESDDAATWTQIGVNADRLALDQNDDDDHFYYEIHSGDSGASY